jgi:hypothetical protein
LNNLNDLNVLNALSGEISLFIGRGFPRVDTLRVMGVENLH